MMVHVRNFVEYAQVRDRPLLGRLRPVKLTFSIDFERPLLVKADTQMLNLK